MMRTPRLFMIMALSVATILAGGCVTVVRLANLGEGSCAATFEARLASILTDQGEKPDVADNLAHHTYQLLTRVEYGPRPFLVASPSGTDYTFFVQKKHERCLLRLYGRQRGFMTYTNNLTYIATRELPGCTCEE